MPRLRNAVLCSTLLVVAHARRTLVRTMNVMNVDVPMLTSPSLYTQIQIT